MSFSKRWIGIVVLMLFFAAGTVNGQTYRGYYFQTGFDSTLWEDMTLANLYEDTTSLIDMGFYFPFCGYYYKYMSIDKWGVLYFDRVCAWSRPDPVFALGYVTGPYLAPFSTPLHSPVVKWKVTGPLTAHKFVVEFSMQMTPTEFWRLQVQLNERDGSIVYLYGKRGESLLDYPFQIGFKGEDGGLVSVSHGHRASEVAQTWTTGVTDWPGKYRYYRFIPNSRRCSAYPKNVVVNSSTDVSARLSWTMIKYGMGYTVAWRPQDGSLPWSMMHTTDTTVELTGLTPMTAYDYRVSSDCCDSCRSDSVEGSFRTICADGVGNQISFWNLHGEGVTCMVGEQRTQILFNEVEDYGPEDPRSRHTVHYDLNERDPRTMNQLRTIPDGQCLSVRLGNWRPWAQRESISYRLHIDTNKYDLMILRYAIVEENPSHPLPDQPKFLLSINDTTGQLIDSCYYANFVAGVGSSAWQEGTVGVVWHDWSTVGIDLTPLHGQTIDVVIDNFDCNLGGHYGYGYFTLESGFKRLQSALCGTVDSNVFYAPKGFSYRWYNALMPSITLSQADSLVVRGEGVYKCRASFTTGDSSCGVTLSTYAGNRYPKASFSAVPVDSCNYTYRFENHSGVASDITLNHLTGEHCEQYLWRFGDGTESTDVNATHTFETGTFNVELVAMLAKGQCRDSVSMEISVQRLVDTINDTFCNGGNYTFLENTYSDTGMYLVTDGCWRHFLHLSQYQYFYQELEDTLCQGEVYSIGNNQFSTDGVYDVKLRAAEGCDSTYRLALTFRPLPESGFTIERKCHGDVYYYLSGVYHEADTSLSEPGSVVFVGEDGLLYRWQPLSQQGALPYLTEDGQVRFAPERNTLYCVQYQYLDSPSCPVVDTVELKQLGEVVAGLEVTPSWLGYDKWELTANDRSSNALGRWWYVNGEQQEEVGNPLYYSISLDADSVVVSVVAYDSTCSDTAVRVIPILRHMLLFPNIFTPSLSKNNTFGPIGSNVTDYELWIFDRRGCLVFHSTDFNEVWDGTSNGIACRQETYAYTCRYTTPTNDKLTMTGTVTLVR